MDGIGPRLTNSPNLRPRRRLGACQVPGLRPRQRPSRAASSSAAAGNSSIRACAHDFARGRSQLAAIPVAWTPAPTAPIRAPDRGRADDKPEHFAAYRGKLAGKIVLVSLPGTATSPSEAAVQAPDRRGHRRRRQSTSCRHFDPDAVDRRLKRVDFCHRARLVPRRAKAPLRWVRKSYRDGKLVSGEGYTTRSATARACPASRLPPRTIAAWRAWRSSARRR